MAKYLVENLIRRDESESDSGVYRLRNIKRNSKPAKTAQPVVSRSLSLYHRLGNNARLVAYTRCGGELNTVEMQLEAIKKYCSQNGYKVVYHYNCDNNTPKAAFNQAFYALGFCDGMIVADINRLVEHSGDPARDLYPLVSDHFFHDHKHLIAVKEHIDTSTADGQNALLDYLRRLIRVA